MTPKNLNYMIRHAIRESINSMINENDVNGNTSAQNVFNTLYMTHRELNKVQRNMMLNGEPEELIEIVAQIDQTIQNTLNSAPQLKGLYYQPK